MSKAAIAGSGLDNDLEMRRRAVPSARDVRQALRLFGDAFEMISVGPRWSDVSPTSVWEDAGEGFENAWARVDEHMAATLRDHRAQLSARQT